jgi:hypothetical protein
MFVKKTSSAKIDYSKQTFSEREKMYIRNEIVLLKLNYPQYIPVLVRSKSEKIKLKKYRFLAGDNLTIAEFLVSVREKMIVPLKSSESLYIFINDIIPRSSSTFSELYTQYKDKDIEMLILTLCVENVFGQLKKMKN